MKSSAPKSEFGGRTSAPSLVGWLPALLTRMYGPAVRCKRVSSIGRCGLASMYPVSDWSAYRLPTWISARASSLADRPQAGRLGHSRARTQWEDRSSISSHSLADLGGYRLLGTITLSLALFLCTRRPVARRHPKPGWLLAIRIRRLMRTDRRCGPACTLLCQGEGKRQRERDGARQAHGSQD